MSAISRRSRATTTTATGWPPRSRPGSDLALATLMETPVPFPAISTEAITVLVHYYRGELTRMISWRDRLDRTTNWAIGALAAMLSISLASDEAHHAVLLFAMLLIHVLLVIEARRYRFFHVYRARVRLLEREYFAPLFSPVPA